MANEKMRITQLPTAPQVEDNDYLAIDNTSTPTAENEGGARKILVKDITAKSADAVEYDNTTSGLEADNVQDAIDEVLEEGGKVQDVKVNGVSVLDNNKTAQIVSYKEVTQAQYDALPSSKLTDGIMYCIKDADFSAEDVPYDNSDSGLESEDVQSAVDEIADVLGALKVEGTVENQSIATFPDGSALPMPKLEVSIEPQQDLHGYDAPWVGGAGKNKLNNVASSKTENNVTFTVNTDGSVKVYSTGATATTTLVLTSNDNPITIKANTEYILNGCPKNGSSSSYELMLTNFPVGGSVVKNDYGDGVTISGSETDMDLGVQIVVRNGQAINDTFYPMIRLASVSDASFAPYSNECPIIGWRAVDVNVSAKNKLPMTVEGIKTANTIGTWSGNSYSINNGTITILTNNDGNVTGIKANGNFSDTSLLNLGTMPVSSATQFICNGCPKGGSNTTYSIQVLSGIAVTDVDNGSGVTFTASEDKTARVVIRSGYNASNLIFYPMIRLASETDATFEPYNPNSENITIQLGDTYYGGKLDVVSGVLTVDRVEVIYDGSSDEGWLLADSGEHRRGYISIANIKSYTGAYNTVSELYICSMLKNGTWNDVFSGNPLAGMTGQNWGFGLDAFQITNVTELRNWLSTNQIEIVYELATPTTIQLTPTQVNSLLGVNNIWADCGKINKAVYIRDLNIVINNLLNA